MAVAETTTFRGAFSRDEGEAMSVRDTTSPIVGIVKQFSSRHADGVDEASAIVHAKAVTILAASGRPVTEANYLSALNAVSSETARQHTEDDVASHCDAAEALSDLAKQRLAERGVFWAPTKSYEDAYIQEIGATAREY